MNVAPHRRHLGMVFQSYAIWPHMTCAKNVAFPLARARARTRTGERWTKQSINGAVQRALDLVQLGHLASRPATSPLRGSSGWRWRGLVGGPAAHAPRSSRCRSRRTDFADDMRIELKRMQRNSASPVLRHARSVRGAGDVEPHRRHECRPSAHSALRSRYTSPRDQFVAEFIGKCNFLSAPVQRGLGSGEWLLDTDAEA